MNKIQKDLDYEKAIKRLFESYGQLLEKINELRKKVEELEKYIESKRIVLIDAEIVSKEVYKIGSYKQNTCKFLIDGKCRSWVDTKSGEYITPSISLCAFCWMYRKSDQVQFLSR